MQKLENLSTKQSRIDMPDLPAMDYTSNYKPSRNGRRYVACDLEL